MSVQRSAISNQFDPAEQIGQTIAALDTALLEAGACVARVRVLAERVRAELDAMRAERDSLEIYDEAEAAALLRIGERALADARRRREVPHIAFRNRPAYTRGHLAEIVKYFESRPKEFLPAKNTIRRAA